MLLKKIVSVLLIVGISCFAFMGAGCSKKSKGKEEPKSPVLVSKDMTIRSLTYAMMHENPELFWNCLSPDSRKMVLETAKQKSMQENVAIMECYTAYKNDFQKHLKKYKNNPEAVTMFLANDPTFPFEQVNGLWYVSLVEKKEEQESGSAPSGFNWFIPVNHSSKTPLVNHLLEGVIAEDHDRVWACLDPRKQKELLELPENKEVEFELVKKQYLQSIRTVVENELEKQGFDADKTVEALTEKLSFVSIGNRWFLK